MWLRGLVTACCLALAAGHILWPNITVDTVTLILVLVAALPWLSSVIKALELPGGFKIELQDVKLATEKVVQPAPETRAAELSGTINAKAELFPAELTVERGPGTAITKTLRQVAATDPNLALAGVGIEVEKRLRELAERSGVDASRWGLSQLIREMQRREILPPEVGAGLRDLSSLRNQAVHGRPVSPDAAAWALEALPTIIASLDQLAPEPGRE